MQFAVVVLFIAFLTYSIRVQTSLDRINRKIDRIARQLEIDPHQEWQLSDRVKQIAQDPKSKITAIKIYRQETGASLKEAKETIEEYIAHLLNPD
jgi:ribosomal protein L7/L12